MLQGPRARVNPQSWGCSGCGGSAFANLGAGAGAGGSIHRVSVEAGAPKGSSDDLTQAPVYQRSGTSTALLLGAAAETPLPERHSVFI